MFRQSWCWLTTCHQADPGHYCGCGLILAPSRVQVGARLASSVGGVGFLARELVDQVPPVLAELS